MVKMKCMTLQHTCMCQNIYHDDFNDTADSKSPDVINTGPFPSVRAWPEHEGLGQLARLLVDTRQALAGTNKE